jgi:ligand-binding sensor domain-containing protein/anti-sigma regulatory factor (Ser/Thr protein kinase)
VFRDLRLTRITTDDGLPQGMVQDILQDQQGYLWFTTKDGLARSDGYDFTIFKHDQDDTTSIGGDHTNILYQDSKGYVWIGVFGVGVDRFDPSRGIFEHVLVQDLERTAYNEILRIREGPQGHIWFNSDAGDLLVVRSDDPAGKLALRPAHQVFPDRTLPRTINSFAFDQAGALWAVQADTLFQYGSQGMRRWQLSKRVAANYGDLEPHLLLYRRSKDEMILSLPGMFVRFNASAGIVLDTLPISNAYRVLDLQLIDDAGRLWYRNDDEIIRRIDLDQGTVEQLRLMTGEKDVYNEMETVFFSCQDNSGNVWGGTRGYGVLKLSSNSAKLQSRRAEQMTGYYMDHYTINGHSQFAMTRHQLKPDPGPAPGTMKRHGFGTPAGKKSWLGAITDPQGRTWGILADGERSAPLLGYVDPAGELRTTNVLSSLDIPNRVLHGQGTEIWVLTSLGRGSWNKPEALVRIDTDALQVTGRYELPVPFHLSKYWPISQWSVAPDGTVWMATIEGLLSLDPHTAAWRVFRHDAADTTSLPANLLFSLCPDPKDPANFLWVGTESKGMAQLDKRTGKFKRVSSRDGLPNDVIYGILSDAQGLLWISTNTGLCRYDPASGTARTYTKADGIAGNEFNRYGSLILPDGRFFFDGMDGGTAFDPAALSYEGATSPTLITGVRLATRSVAMHELERGNADPVPSITIPYNEPLVTFRFAVMDHTAPERNTFRYQLIGYTNGWIDGAARNEATFTNLDPGTYMFEVQGTNHAGLSDPVHASIRLTVTSPWWGTWWFRTIMALAFFGAVYAIYRIRLQQHLRVIAVREGIARDLHDEIGSTLSSVALYGAVARKRIKDLAPADRTVLERISDGASAAIGSMNDIVWAVSTEKNASEHVTQRMQRFASDICDAKGIELEFELGPAMASMDFDLTQRKNLYLIFKEAVHNAVKYAACSRIEVKLWKEGEVVIMTVSDNGNGFELDGTADGMGGNGIHNMHARANELQAELSIGSGAGKGTVVTLKFEK